MEVAGINQTVPAYELKHMLCKILEKIVIEMLSLLQMYNNV